MTEAMHATVEDRARMSRGTSTDQAIYEMVKSAFEIGPGRIGTLLDVGCGTGSLENTLKHYHTRYVGADVVQYDGFPKHAEWFRVDAVSGTVPLERGFAEVTTAIETIEHVENPRAFLRELVRLTRPGGWVIVTTPNQLSLLSKLTLVVKNQFNAFQDGSYPAHLTALLEIDLHRMACECGLTSVQIGYSKHGRIPGTSRHYPLWISKAFPRTFSDNILMAGRTPLKGLPGQPYG